MKSGIYKHIRYEGIFGGVITIRVSETEKSYVFELIENTFRYSPTHIDMLFSKLNRAVINKDKNPHAIRVYENDFVIYPFRSGIPFLFEYTEQTIMKKERN